METSWQVVVKPNLIPQKGENDCVLNEIKGSKGLRSSKCSKCSKCFVLLNNLFLGKSNQIPNAKSQTFSISTSYSKIHPKQILSIL